MMSREEIHWIKAAQQVLPQLRRCHLVLWPGLIWLSSACSLHSVCLPPVPVENMYHTEQETSRVTDTTPSAHAGSNLCCPFPDPSAVSFPGTLLIDSNILWTLKEAANQWMVGDLRSWFYLYQLPRAIPGTSKGNNAVIKNSNLEIQQVCSS